MLYVYVDWDCLFDISIFFFLRHIEVPAIFEDPNSLKQVKCFP